VLAHRNRAKAYAAKGDWQHAIADCTRAIELRPDDAAAYLTRSAAYAAKEEWDAATADCTRAIELAPAHADAYLNRALAYTEKGEWDRAVADLTAARRIGGDDPVVLRSLAWLLATCPEDRIRDGKRALECATKACDLTGWQRPEFLNALAAACAETGQFEQAQKWERKALLDPALPRPDWDRGRARLKLYEESKPYREQPAATPAAPARHPITK
jgi:Flp pilus assembly protein TadD